LTAAEQQRQFDRIKREIEELRGKAKRGEEFVALSDDELRKKLKRTNTPFFHSFSTVNAPPGGTIGYSVGVTNPDPVPRSSLFVHVFVGPGNPVSDLGDFLQVVDARFPRLTQPTASGFGLTLAPGTSQTLSFSVNVPANMEQGRYLFNAVLIQLSSFDVGTYMDRCAASIQVT